MNLGIKIKASVVKNTDGTEKFVKNVPHKDCQKHVIMII